MSTSSTSPKIELPPGLANDEELIYRQTIQDFLDALPPGTAPNIFLLKDLHNAAAHAVTCHRANRLLHTLNQLPPDQQAKQHPIQARLLAQAARNTQITTKLLAEIETRWPAVPAAQEEDPASRLGKYAPYLSRFQDLMDQIDLEETARELGCESHEVPGLPTRIPFPEDPPLRPKPHPTPHPSHPSDPSDQSGPPLPPQPPAPAPPPLKPKPQRPSPLVHGF